MTARRFFHRVLVGLVIVGAAVAPATLAGGAPAPYSGLLGTWTNPSTTGVVKLVISPAGTGMTVDSFAKCTGPALCESGKVAAVVFGTGAGSPTGRFFRTNQAFSTYNRIMMGSLVATSAGPRITVSWYLTFKGGVNYNAWVTRTFTRVGPATSTPKVGTASSTYPAGRQPHAPDNFLGTWKNTNPATPSVVKYVITRQEDGSLLVHEYGACSPTPCDNGTSNAIAYGASTTTPTATRFLAPSDYGFQREVRIGSLVNGVLHVSAWIQFTDGSGRSNYGAAETFTH
jgi:hypothetical protein